MTEDSQNIPGGLGDNSLTSVEKINRVLELFGGGKPEYIFKTGFSPTDEEFALIEDVDFMFLTGEHPSNIPRRARKTPNYLSSLHRRAGFTTRANIFKAVYEETKGK